MFRPVELFIGLRYTRAKRRNHFISFISATSIVGIALGVTALITVLSVMNGFQREVRTGILGMASHAAVSSLNGALADWRGLVDELQRQPRVLGAAPFIEAQGMLSYEQFVSGALIRGVLPEQEPKVSFIGEKMIRGRLEDLRAGEFGIILGRDLAASLGAVAGDKITLITPQANVTPVGTLPRLKRFTVVGLFYVGNNEYDRALALMHMEDAARLFQTGGSATGVRLKLDDIYAAPLAARALRQQLPRDLAVTDWTQQHVNFFRAVAIEKRMMFIILTLIVAVAAFNIVSTLVMVVQDKRADIAILRTLGLTPRSVMAVFMVQGSIIGVFGTLLGVAGGVLLALNVEIVVSFIEQAFGIRFLSPDVYLISEVPSELHWDDVVNIGSVALILGLLSTLYPAWRAARTQPAEALRYE
jgi:lipoprotein-releasing system permease protein